MPETKPNIVSHEPSVESSPLFDPEILQEFLGGDWQHASDEFGDYFALKDPETEDTSRLVFDRSETGELRFRAYLKGKGETYQGRILIPVDNVSSVVLIPEEASQGNERMLRVRSERKEFKFYPTLLEGQFNGDTYFSFGRTWENTSNSIEFDLEED